MKKKELFLSKDMWKIGLWVFLLFVSGGIGYYYYEKPVAYIEIDVNPSMEISINGLGKVIGIKGYNQEGKQVIHAKQLEWHNIKELVTLLLNRAQEKGYLLSDGSSTVSFTVVSDDSTEIQKLKDMCGKVATAFANQATFVTAQMGMSQYNQAQAVGISPGKFHLIEALQHLNPHIQINDYKNASIKEIVQTIIALRKKMPSPTFTDLVTNEQIDIPDKSNISPPATNSPITTEPIQQPSLTTVPTSSSSIQKDVPSSPTVSVPTPTQHKKTPTSSSSKNPSSSGNSKRPSSGNNGGTSGSHKGSPVGEGSDDSGHDSSGSHKGSPVGEGSDDNGHDSSGSHKGSPVGEGSDDSGHDSSGSHKGSHNEDNTRKKGDTSSHVGEDEKGDGQDHQPTNGDD